MASPRLLAVTALAAALIACSARPAPPNLLVLMIDALRADHLGCYGYGRETSPHIDTLASQSLLFVNAYAQSPWTKPSIPTLFTSLYPMQHRVYEGERRGPDGRLRSDILVGEVQTLAEVLSGAGFDTAGFVNNAHLSAEHGFDQGFRIYEQANLDGAEINRRFLEFVDGSGNRPFFAYLHYLDVHWPFQPAAELRDYFGTAGDSSLFEQDDWNGLRKRINRGSIQLSEADRARLIALHDAGILEIDQRIGELEQALRQRGLLERTVIVLTSDHGEELLDHGRIGHGGTLFEEVLRIPLMIRLPGTERAARVEEPARLLDIHPTLLRLAGVTPPEGLEGRDLLGGGPPPAQLIAETRHKRVYTVSVREGRWKYVRRYRARGIRTLASDRPETFGLEPGMRLKVKGHFDADGTLVARKISIKDSADDDIELSGPVAELDRDSGEFRLYGVRVVPDDALRGIEAESLWAALEEGTWVKVEGELATGNTLRVDELARLPPGEHKPELEGILTAIEPALERTARARIGSLTLRVSERTRVQGPLGERAQQRAARSPTDDPFTPERLLSERNLAVETMLFDLEQDPAEKRNLAAHAPIQLARLHGALEHWLERMRAQGRQIRAPQRELKSREIEELRGLGYVE